MSFCTPVEYNKVYDTVSLKNGAFELKGKVTGGRAAYNCYVMGKADDWLELLWK